MQKASLSFPFYITFNQTKHNAFRRTNNVPMHMRGPTPNGKMANGWILPKSSFSQRSGLNSKGDLNNFSERPER